MTLQNSAANPFSRTTRSLKTDQHTATLLGLATVIVLLLVWAVWFFAAGIAINQSSEQAEVTRAQRVTAIFSPETSEGIKRGQTASFYPQGEEWEQAGPVPAIVSDVSADSATHQTRVELALRPESSLPAPLKEGHTGRVDIELETVSPATLVFRAGGLVTQPTNQNGVAN